jgi:hypothetical protein
LSVNLYRSSHNLELQIGAVLPYQFQRQIILTIPSTCSVSHTRHHHRFQCCGGPATPSQAGHCCTTGRFPTRDASTRPSNGPNRTAAMSSQEAPSGAPPPTLSKEPIIMIPSTWRDSLSVCCQPRCQHRDDFLAAHGCGQSRLSRVGNRDPLGSSMAAAAMDNL